jgi:hypothetical protein
MTSWAAVLQQQSLPWAPDTTTTYMKHETPNAIPQSLPPPLLWEATGLRAKLGGHPPAAASDRGPSLAHCTRWPQLAWLQQQTLPPAKHPASIKRSGDIAVSVMHITWTYLCTG